MVNYNEFTNSIIYPSGALDPMFRWGEHFPERLSRLSHHAPELFSPVARRQTRRSRDRYKTQPITFDEITEVDEDTAAAAAKGGTVAPLNPNQNQKGQTPGFSRSMDGLTGGARGDAPLRINVEEGESPEQRFESKHRGSSVL